VGIKLIQERIVLPLTLEITCTNFTPKELSTILALAEILDNNPKTRGITATDPNLYLIHKTGKVYK
jgi:hypothetical protein